MAGERELKIKIVGDAAGFERALKKGQTATASFGEHVKKHSLAIGVALGNLGSEAAVAVGEHLVDAMHESIAAAQGAQVAQARLGAQLKTFGNDTVEVKGHIEEVVGEMSTMNGFKPTALTEAFGTLVRNTRSVSKAQSEMNIVMNVARAKHIDVAKAADMVNRINITGAGALKKFGIEIDKHATKQQALAKLAKTVAGQAAAYAGTAAGQQERFAAAQELAYEKVGNALLPIRTALYQFAADWMPVVVNALEKYLIPALHSVTEFVLPLVSSFRPLIESFTGIAGASKSTGSSVDGMGAKFAAIQAKIEPLAIHMRALLGTAIQAIGTIVKAVMPVIVEAFGTLGPPIMRFYTDVAKIDAVIFRVLGVVVPPIVRALRPLFSGVFGAIADILNVVSDLLEGNWRGAIHDLLDIPKKILGGLAGVFKNLLAAAIPAVISGASSIGNALIEGIKSAISSGYGKLKSTLETMLRNIVNNLNPFSPVEHGGEIIGDKLHAGMRKAIHDGAGKTNAALSKVIRDAVTNARGNLTSLTGSLGGMLGTMMTSPQSKQLATMQAEDKARQRADTVSGLNSALADAQAGGDPAAIIAAQKALSDNLRKVQEEDLQQSISDKQQKYQTDMDNLAASFETGKISAKQFQASLKTMIGGQTGAGLGSAFAMNFAAQLAGVTTQVSQLAAYGGVASSGISTTNPAAAAAAEYARELKSWRDARTVEVKKLNDDVTSKKITAAEKAVDLAKWEKSHPKPVKLAAGGVATRMIVAGESGPEAILPLSSAGARSILASALAQADQMNGGGAGATTIVNVTVNGVVSTDLRAFARKLQPELQRVITLKA